jgi:spore germination cell wall hydrolase CwlJ-like protein
MKTLLLTAKLLAVTPETECLALNMYFEARNQNIAGLLAVTNVVYNRVKDKRYPNTVCEVVQQGPTRLSWKNNGIVHPVKNKCQFSWYCDGKSYIPTDIKAYNSILLLANNITTKKVAYIDLTDGATHYHADYVLPSWASTKTKTVEINDHIFYRWETVDD